MKNLKRILSFLLVTAMLFTCVTVFAVENAEETAKTYFFDLSIENSVSENHFRYDAISKKDGRLVGAESTARGTWSDTWLGYWPVGGTGKSDYVFYDTEDKYYGSIIDMSCSGDYKSAVVFTAPEDGVYDIYVKGIKYQAQEDAILDVALMRNGYSQPLATAIDVCGANNAGEVVFDVKAVRLSAGDEIMLVTTLSKLNTRVGCDNFGIIKFDVTKTGTEGGYTYGNPTYEFGCGLDGKTCGNFYLAGRNADGKIDRLQMTLGTAWGAWKGWRLSDNSDYVFCETQVSNSKLSSDPHGLNGQFAYIDMMPKTNYDSVVVFTAPVSGTYSFDALFSKLNIAAGRPSGYKIEALKGDEVLASHTFATQTPAEKHEDANLTGSDVNLKTGETIMFVASHVSDNPHDAEIAIRSIEVTLVNASCEHEWVNGVCKSCYSYCVHEWEDGVCTTCGTKCVHGWNNSICDYCEASCEHDWSYANGESTCALCGKVTEEVYVEYVSNLGLENTVDGYFSIAALRNDGVVCPIETSPRQTWSPDPIYFGNWVAGATTPKAYVTQRTECKFSSDVKFDMYPTADEIYAAAIVFEAPADGIFNVDAKLNVIYAAKVEIVLWKNGTKLLTKKASEWREAIDIEKGNIELNKGDQLIIAVYKGDAGDALNTGFISFNVGGLFKTCPHVWNAENGECTVCGFACTDHTWYNGECGNCGKTCSHDVDADDATCQKAAVCSICGYEVAPVNADKHTAEVKYHFNSDMTHTAYYACCNTTAGTEECVRGEDDKCVCGIDFSLLDKAANLDNIIDDFFANEGKLTGDYTVSGPAAGALDGFKVVKPADNLGVEYAHFNLRYEEERGLILRHHFISNVDEFTLTVNGEVITPENVEGTNIYFFDVIYPIATYDQAAKIVIEVDGETVEYNVSIYSYLAIALEKGDESTQTLAKAIYDLNEGCLKYLAEKE